MLVHLFYASQQKRVAPQGARVTAWPGKYVIGLTGNIATGKSVVRKMLEHLGAYGIDADALSHRVIARGAPGYQPVVDMFGRWLLDSDGQIDRGRLGTLVFNDPDALRKLESIVHPLVRRAIETIGARASQTVIVIEAIKLLEGNLRDACDTIWVTVSSEPLQVERLMAKRGMGREEALARIRMQPPQAEKSARADVIIRNMGTFEETWRQVVAGWRAVHPQLETAPLTSAQAGEAGFTVVRGRPRDSNMIAELLTRLSGGAKPTTAEDVMAAFGEMAFLILRRDGQPVGVAGWQVENLVARTTAVFVDPSVPLDRAFSALIAEVEEASIHLQCEASLLFLPRSFAAQESSLRQLGYEPRTPNSLGVQAWHDAALESAQPDTTMFFKQLRKDRVLRPI